VITIHGRSAGTRQMTNVSAELKIEAR
jgi:hypothetical protein